MLKRVRSYASFIRFSHTVFALPFALTGALLAAQTVPLTWVRMGWILTAMVTARTAAMSFNRLVDAKFDSNNPRTAGRELPQGIVSTREASTLVVISSVAFVITTVMLGPLCFALSPVALLIIFWYSLAKRYTTYTQLFLGLALAVAPMGGWLAAGGRWGLAPWLLAFGTAMWVAGFDIIYACEDVEFDRKNGLFSIPVRFGIKRAIWISRGLHVVTILMLASIALVMPLGLTYVAGVAGVAVLLGYEQTLVSPDDLSRVKQAFDLNGYVGLLYLMTTAVALYV